MFVGLGVALFTFAAAAGIWTNWPRLYAEGEVEDMKKLTEPEYWDAPREYSPRRAGQLRVNILRDHRSVNRRKATGLKWAMGFELAATGAIATSVILTLVLR